MKKKIYIFNGWEDSSKWIADYFINYVKKHPQANLGFATGISPLGVYDLIKKDHKENNTDWSGIKSFNLDEFVGVPLDHKESFRHQMDTNLFSGINLKEENIFIPDGLSAHPCEEAKVYEAKINQAGGIDLQYISLGVNGHMAYNEPGTPLDSLTHVATLNSKTRDVLVDQKKFASLDETPTQAITVGVQTIMNFKQMFMIAIGENKRVPAKLMLEGPVSSDVPSSKLQDHFNTIFILDSAAAADLDLNKFEVTDFRG